MPSLHVAWAVWVALAVVVAFPAARWRHVAWAYPVSTTLVVMGTGNHFLADTVAGAALIVAAWLVAAHVAAWRSAQLTTVSVTEAYERVPDILARGA
jgi:hypothetical protein